MGVFAVPKEKEELATFRNRHKVHNFVATHINYGLFFLITCAATVLKTWPAWEPFTPVGDVTMF